MAETTEDKRFFLFKARYQGLLLMGLGVLSLLNPLTAPYAGTIITVGAGWATGGAASKLARDKTNSLSK
jgi:hypothetical protein